MVSIAGGKFQMGAHQDESKSLEDERPQHIVTLNTFYMGKYPITQAQWKVIAKLPKIKRCLKLEPSCFKGDNLPVERVIPVLYEGAPNYMRNEPQRMQRAQRKK
ncbi:formylglycine-generating enzyme family protein [Nostoc sp.]|uniref:formylglycine-generating enzyme family protein n=1 Tax=Nostoc sp. TaxID=1180 RepID=UPI002FF45614